jgi:prepilin-type N-terminal cleavage/methylation domain-containing protein
LSGTARHDPSRGRRRTAPRSFTLAELLVAMAIIAIIAAITVVSVRGIAKDARLSSGTNAVTAALDNARALAMKNNEIVLVAFRARPDGPTEQYIEAVTARFSGESYLNPDVGVVDRFVPISDAAARELPGGIKIAGPLYGGNVDYAWAVSSDLPAIESAGEAGGAVIAAMYAPDGTLITQNPATDSNRIYVDFNNDGYQRQGEVDYSNLAGVPPEYPDNDNYCYMGEDADGYALNDYFCQVKDDDEPYVSMAPFLAVFDDDAAREQYDTTLWGDGQIRRDDLTAFISVTADRIHFNRYTGVVMR